MPRSIGVLATRYIWAGVVEDSNLGTVLMYPEPGAAHVDLKSLPAEEIVSHICHHIEVLRREGPIDSVGAGIPGIIRRGLIEESPNLGQLKGLDMETRLRISLLAMGLDVPVKVMNDADALAAGLASRYGALDRIVRAWYLGDGIGFGRYPQAEGVWEGGHMVVSLDPKEHFCGCGGQGHLEGIVGSRAMRLRFLDMEPDEVFAAARQGDRRTAAFVSLWHRAIAAATATSVHIDGPGRFYIAGPNADFVDVNSLSMCLQDMVKMTPLQGTFFEIVPTSQDLALIGAAMTSRK